MPGLIRSMPVRIRAVPCGPVDTTSPLRGRNTDKRPERGRKCHQLCWLHADPHCLLGHSHPYQAATADEPLGHVRHCRRVDRRRAQALVAPRGRRPLPLCPCSSSSSSPSSIEYSLSGNRISLFITSSPCRRRGAELLRRRATRQLRYHHRPRRCVRFT